MRGMMVTVQGEDYMTFAEALGLTGRRRFLQYGLRNAILPQVTLLALSLGHVLSGSILVELVFGYPGIGQQLFRAIQNQDYFVIYGIVLVLICALAHRHAAGGPDLPAARSAHPAWGQDRLSASTSAAAAVAVAAGSSGAASRCARRGARAAAEPRFMLGLVLIVGLIAFAVIGRVFAGWNDAFPLSAPPSMPPDGEWIFGTDADGRDLLAVIVYGTLLTLKIGVIAGCLGLGIGTTLAFVAAYHGGWLDAVDARRRRRAADHSHPARAGGDRLGHPPQREHHDHRHHHRPARLARTGAADPRPGAGDARGAVCEAGDPQRRVRGCASSFLR